ncbi:MAG: biotin/lipoyl-binding protein [Methylococcales bacterium]
MPGSVWSRLAGGHTSHPRPAGQVAELTVREGSGVTRGQILMTVWTQDLRAQIDLARADATAGWAASGGNLRDLGRREADRLLKLRQHSEIVSEESVDTRVTESESRAAACRAAKASVAVNEASIQAAEAAREHTLVKALFDGVVAEVQTPSPSRKTPLACFKDSAARPNRFCHWWSFCDDKISGFSKIIVTIHHRSNPV